MLKRAWTDPVWSKVIASTIFGLAVLGLTYLANLWFGPFAPLNENKTLSDSESLTELRKHNLEAPKTVERSTSKLNQPIPMPTLLKQSGNDQESSTRAQNPNSPTMRPTQAEPKELVVGKPCGQPTAGLKRQPKVFVPAWLGALNSLRKERTIHDLRNLFEVWGRIPVGIQGKDLIQEAAFTLKCLEGEGEIRVENLGTSSTYWGENFENQRIDFVSRPST